MRRSDGWTQNWAAVEEIKTDTNTVSFVQKLAASDAFKSLFKEGMSLVEESAAYLDGAGREESRKLPRPAALARLFFVRMLSPLPWHFSQTRRNVVPI